VIRVKIDENVIKQPINGFATRHPFIGMEQQSLVISFPNSVRGQTLGNN